MTIICEGGDRVGKSTVCNFLKNNGFLYYHFDYPKKEDVVSIYNDYFKSFKNNKNDQIYDRAMYSEYAYSRYYDRKSNMTEDNIHILEDKFKKASKDNKVCILYIENGINENLKLLKDEGEGKITSISDIIRLREFYYQALNISTFPIFTYNYQIQDIQDILKQINKFFV